MDILREGAATVLAALLRGGGGGGSQPGSQGAVVAEGGAVGGGAAAIAGAALEFGLFCNSLLRAARGDDTTGSSGSPSQAVAGGEAAGTPGFDEGALDAPAARAVAAGGGLAGLAVANLLEVRRRARGLRLHARMLCVGRWALFRSARGRARRAGERHAWALIQPCRFFCVRLAVCHCGRGLPHSTINARHAAVCVALV